MKTVTLEISEGSSQSMEYSKLNSIEVPTFNQTQDLVRLKIKSGHLLKLEDYEVMFLDLLDYFGELHLIESGNDSHYMYLRDKYQADFNLMKLNEYLAKYLDNLDNVNLQ